MSAKDPSATAGFYFSEMQEDPAEWAQVDAQDELSSTSERI